MSSIVAAIGPSPVTNTILRVDIHGTPIPQGAIRHLGKGRPSIHANKDTLLPWRDHVQFALERAMDSQASIEWPLGGPVAVAAIFTMRKPTTAPKKRQTWPITRPDVDKLARAVLDAMQNAGTIQDDSQCTTLVARKVYPNEAPDALSSPGVRLYLALDAP